MSDRPPADEPPRASEPPAEDPTKDRGFLARMTKNKVAANVIMMILFVGGIVAAGRVRQEVFPEFDLDMVLVQVTYPGASPAEVEQGVALAVEEAVRGLDGVKEVRSTASEGVATIAIELMLGTNAQRALSDVESAVGRITSFPVDIERPIVSLATLRGEAISLVIYGDASEAALRAHADRVRDELLQHPRITTIELAGVRPLEIHVEAPEARLRSYGLRLEELAAAVRQASVEIPGGAVKTRRGEVLLRTAGRRATATEFENIVVRSQPDGTIVRVRDVASVTDGFREVDQEASYDGHRAVMVKVFRVGDQTPIELANAVQEYARDHAHELPPGVHFAIWNDRSEIYAQRLDLLRRNAIMGLLLVMLVLGLFLETRLAFWVTLGIPISFLGTLLFLPATGVTINMISLFAFILTLGIVVDDAIVVAEAVYHHRQQGKGALAAAILGVKEVAVPVTFSVLTTVVAFTPLLFVPGTMGKFFMNIPVIVILVLLLSLFESLFILPAHLSEEGGTPRGVFAAIRRVQDRFQAGLTRFIERVYAPLQRRAVEHRYLTIAIGIAILLASFGLVAGGRLEFTFFPRIESDIVSATVTMPFGTSVEDTRAVEERLLRVGQELTEEMGGGPEVRRGTFAVLGSTGASGGGGPRGGAAASGSHIAQVAIQLVSSDHRDFRARQLAEAWRERMGDVPGVDTLVFDYSTGGPGGAAIDFVVSHRDLGVLETASAQLASRLGELAGVRDVDDGFSEGKAQIDFTLRPEARALGITETDLGRQLRNAFFGSEAVRQQRGRDEVRVFVRRPLEERASLASIEGFLLRTPGGGEIPLSEAAVLARGHAYTQIQRVDGRRVVHVTADIEEGANANRIVERVLREAVPGVLADHPGLAVTLGGDQQRQGEALGALGMGFLLALVAMYALMAIPFRSYVQPIIIMTAIPFSFVGAIYGHLLMGYDLSLMSAMGLVALAGVAVNDSLVYIDAANELRRGGKSANAAVLAAGVRRFRPIMLTSLTTFFGLAPMILESSVQARFLVPMALSLGFGVLFCTFTTLLLVPALYMVLEDVLGAVRRAGAWWREDDGGSGPTISTEVAPQRDAAE
ncbi:MAG: efflux RND transporter permease subunit [Myxococcota bacterium]|nr:efflux RND transporter permease subunit [Myxococcota bacterium]